MVLRLAVPLMLWVLLASPALCVAGLLHHPCSCEEEPCCDREEECPADPCGGFGLRPHSRDGRADLAHLPALGCPDSATVEHDPSLAGWCFSLFPQLFKPNLPYPPSDLPLII